MIVPGPVGSSHRRPIDITRPAAQAVAWQQALQAAGEQVTDESSAMEAMGWQPRLVPGSARNFKVTYPEDFALAEALLLSDTHRKASS